jgi:hypothetical protein
MRTITMELFSKLHNRPLFWSHLKRVPSITWPCLLLWLGLLLSCDGPSDLVDFSTQIKPILNNKCITCHGGVKKSGGFSLLFKDEAFANTDSGQPAIIPGNAKASEFIKRLHEEDPELRMPYEKPKLTEEEITLLTKWIDQGAQWGEHWAYELPEEVTVPKVPQEASFMGPAQNTFLQNDIDAFILARLEEESLSPNPPAPETTILRRLALDLTGLPPTAALHHDFVNGNITYEMAVDQLLAQPSFGEKWASWWLDLARYADTKGYEKDQGRSMWRYRDWVIQALNDDMPYDRFTTEQLAGDLLPNPSVDQLIATAFHRNTMNNDEGGTQDEEFRVAAVMDRVNTTFSVWQSTTMECVQCHSHPYDPFKHEEYFKALAFFNNSRDEDTPDESPTLRFYNEEQEEKKQELLSWISQWGTTEDRSTFSDFLSFMEPKYQAHNAKEFVNGELADTKFLALWDDGSCVLEQVDTRGASAFYMYYRAFMDGTVMTIRKDGAEGEILAQFTLNKTQGSEIAKIPFKKMTGPVHLFFEANNDRIAKQVSTSHISWFAFLPDLPGDKAPGYGRMERTFLELLNSGTPELPIMVEGKGPMARVTQVFDRGNWLLLTDTVQPGTPKS